MHGVCHSGCLHAQVWSELSQRLIVVSLLDDLATDPTGSLAPGEVHIKSSRRNLVGSDGTATELIEGEVLIRHFEPSCCSTPY